MSTVLYNPSDPSCVTKFIVFPLLLLKLTLITGFTWSASSTLIESLELIDLRLFAESQGSASAKKEMTKFFNLIEDKSGETNIDEFFRLIDEAVLKGIDLAAMMDARNFYATNTKTLGAKTSVFKAIQNGSGEALFKFLEDIDEIYKKLSNSEQSISGALGITTFLKNQVVTETSTFSMKLLYRLSKFLENQKIESGLVFL